VVKIRVATIDTGFEHTYHKVKVVR